MHLALSLFDQVVRDVPASEGYGCSFIKVENGPSGTYNGPTKSRKSVFVQTILFKAFY